MKPTETILAEIAVIITPAAMVSGHGTYDIGDSDEGILTGITVSLSGPAQSCGIVCAAY